MVRRCLRLDPRDGEEVFDWLVQTSVAVDPVFFQGVDGFGGVGFREFAVGVDAELGVAQIRSGNESGKVIRGLIDD